MENRCDSDYSGYSDNSGYGWGVEEMAAKKVGGGSVKIVLKLMIGALRDGGVDNAAY